MKILLAISAAWMVGAAGLALAVNDNPLSLVVCVALLIGAGVMLRDVWSA